MIGQDDNRINNKWSRVSLLSKTLTEKSTRRIISKQWRSTCCHDREEERPSANPVSSEVRHEAQ